MSTIKIISNPYAKEIKFQKYDSSNDSWQSIDYEHNENSKLLRQELIKGFFPFSGISDEDLYQSFKKINNEVSKERNMIVGEKWTNMTMVVERSGKLEVDFDYTDLTECAYQYSKKWKKKYLV